MDFRNELRQLLSETQDDYWRERLAAETGFLEQLLAEGGLADSAGAEGKLESALREISKRVQSEGAVTRDGVLAFEDALTPLSSACKALELDCVGHAHIDMNWMWGFHETVSITIDTFRTVLGLLDRFPRFRFSQSQAAVYRMIERYAPQLIDPIREQIAAGRWEVTATQWVESDMNLPSGESLVRQMLYARRYLTELYRAPEESFELVFLPDTFGHNANTPELLAAAGVRYLYHCRGAVGPHLSRWEAPSGRSIIVYREPRWYNTDVSGSVGEFLPRFARETGLKRALCLYGVGDHGGGPTVRDIERLGDMGEWPLFPTVAFGTLGGYFRSLRDSSEGLPTVRGERNMIFTGCYSSQSRIKEANRRAEKLLYEAELDTALARLERGKSGGDELVAESLRDGWTKALFSNFHDILPGSGVRVTRDYALGSFQETAAAALAAQSEALRRLSGEEGVPPITGGRSARSEGAGVGYRAERFELPATERGSGPERLYHLYNPLQWERDSIAEITVWDWPGDPEVLECVDHAGNHLDHLLIEAGREKYWGHRYLRLRLRVRVPAFGYTAVRVREAGRQAKREVFFPWRIERWMVENPVEAVLENSRVRARFDPTSMRLESLLDKASGRELIGADDPSGGAGTGTPLGGYFRYVEEEAGEMTAWIVGRYQSVHPLLEAARIVESRIDPALPEQWVAYEAAITTRAEEAASRMRVRVSLERDTSRLRYEVDCHWLEAGVAGGRVPQLQYCLRPVLAERSLRCDIPFGTIERGPAALDVPGNSFAALLPVEEAAPVLQLTTDSREAFRFDDNTASVTLLRSSVDPDPYPELGRHQFSFALSVLEPQAAQRPILSLREALELRHPLRPLSLAPASTGSGASVAEESSFLSVEAEGCVVAAVKAPEPARWSAEPSDENPPDEQLIVRLYETEGEECSVTVAAPKGSGIRSARLLDLHERPLADVQVEGGQARLSVAPRQIATVELVFEARAGK